MDLISIRGLHSPDKDLVVENIEEAKIEGAAVLGRVKGTFFVPGGMSRNKRHYPRSLWEKVIHSEKVKEKLQNRTMYGTVGHKQKLDDEAILEGKVSHIVTELYIDEEGNGIGEAFILDTPAGRTLNTLLRAGSKLYVSSRATGRFKGQHNGVPQVDENHYKFETFDFVIDPGFLQANPDLKEELDLALKNENDNMNRNQGDFSMDEASKLYEMVKDQNKELSDTNRDLQRKLSDKNEEINTLKEERNNLQSEVQDYTEIKEAKESLEESIKAYQELGEAKEVQKVIDENQSLKEQLEEYKGIDEECTASEIKETFEDLKTVLEEYREFGKTPKEAKEAFEAMQSKIEAYEEYGTVEEVAEVGEIAERLTQVERERKQSEDIAKLSKKVGVTEDRIKKVYDKLSEEEIVELFKDEEEAKKWREEKKRLNEGKEGDVKVDNNDDDDVPFYKKGSLCESLIAKNS